MSGWLSGDEIGRAAELVGAVHGDWLDLRIVKLIQEASRCISPFDEAHIDAVQEYLESIILKYIDNQRYKAIVRAEGGDFSPAEEIYGYPLITSGDLFEIDRFCPGVSDELDDEGRHELVLTDRAAYGSAITDALHRLSGLELLDRSLEAIYDHHETTALEFEVPELYSVLGLSILTSEIFANENTHRLSVEVALEAAEAIYIGRIVLESDQTYESVKKRAAEARRRGGERRHAGHQRLKEHAWELYTKERETFENRSEASRQITPLVQKYADDNQITKLSEARAEQTVYEWLSAYDKQNKK